MVSSLLLLPEFGAHPFTSVAVKEIFLSERVIPDIPTLSEHDTKDVKDKDASANNKLVLCLLMYTIALAIMSADSLKQMIIKLGSLYSKDIGVGVLTP